MSIIADKIHKYQNDFHLAELLKGGSISITLKIIGLVTGYVFSIIVARALGAESWGIYSICFAIITISSIFARSGFDTTIMRLNAEYSAFKEEQKLISLSKLVFKFTLLISILITITVYLSSDFIAINIFSKPRLTNSIQLVSLAIAPYSLSLIIGSALKGLKQIPKAAFIEHVAKFAFMLIIFLIGILLFELSVESIVQIIVISAWMMFLISMFWYWDVIRRMNYLNSAEFDWKPIFKIASSLILASSVLYIKGWIDTISIGILMTEKDAGIYNIAQKLANLTVIPLVTISTIAAPKFAENILNKIELKHVLRKSIKLIILISTPILLVIILLRGPLLTAFGHEFLIAETALVIVAFAAFINGIFGSFGFLLQMTGHHLAYQNSVILLILISVVLNISLVPLYGLIGAAWATLIVNIMWNTILILYVRFNIVK